EEHAPMGFSNDLASEVSSTFVAEADILATSEELATAALHAAPRFTPPMAATSTAAAQAALSSNAGPALSGGSIPVGQLLDGAHQLAEAPWQQGDGGSLSEGFELASAEGEISNLLERQVQELEELDATRPPGSVPVGEDPSQPVYFEQAVPAQ